ncbi:MULTISPECIES: hypothetical protein [unclassified Nocardia]|uniref:hypothetical protein n=1 Tax=unclassified Nocardia TaxID=2637762 RepID=UPI00278BDCA9|nr:MULTISPECIES: hypothetical protein [unclassified Nocardia]
MNAAPTPQDALQIAADATEQARRAPAMPGWVPPVAGLLGGSGLVLFNLGQPARSETNIELTLTGTALLLTLAALMAWLHFTQRNDGVRPRAMWQRPARRWARVSVFLVPILFGAIVGTSLEGGPLIPFGMAMGGWIWFVLARQRGIPWRI